MDSVLWIAAWIAVPLGFAGIVLPLLPGMPLLFGGLWLFAWLDDYARVSGGTVAVLGVMALVAWLADYLAAALGVRRVGASRLAVAGAALGAACGLFAGPLGLLFGPIAGAVAGEWLARRQRLQSLRAGLAAGAGFLVAIAAKLAIGIAMLGIFLVAYFA